MSSEIESYCKESAKNLESNRKKRKKRKVFHLILHCIKKNRWRLSASHAVVNLKQMFLISRGMEFPEDLRAFSLIIFKSLSLHLFIFVKPVFSFKLVIKYKRLSSQIAQLSLSFFFSHSRNSSSSLSPPTHPSYCSSTTIFIIVCSPHKKPCLFS